MEIITAHTGYIDIHSHNPLREKNVFRLYNLNLADYVSTQQEGPVSTGLHPWHIAHFDHLGELRSLLVEAAADDRVLAIGEAGMDKVITTSMALQEDIFITHVDISEEAGKPMIIHCVKAFQELIRIRQETGGSQPWIIHGYNSSPEMAEELASKGFYISVGERLLRNRHKSREILNSVPLSMVFAETDDDERPISEIYEQMAGLSGISVKEMKEYLAGNFKKVFGK